MWSRNCTNKRRKTIDVANWHNFPFSLHVVKFKEMKFIFLDFICLRKLDWDFSHISPTSKKQAMLTALKLDFIHKNSRAFQLSTLFFLLSLRENLFNGYFDCYHNLKSSDDNIEHPRTNQKNIKQNRNNFINIYISIRLVSTLFLRRRFHL